MAKRAFLIVLDSMGIGAMPDAGIWNDEGSNTLNSIRNHPAFSCPNLTEMGLFSIDGIEEKIREYGTAKVCEECGIGAPTLHDIVKELQKPGRDIRDSFEPVALREDVMNIEDLKPDMILTGTVRNVIDFGAFVDIGVHQDGLVHISELSDRFVKHPSDVVSLGDRVEVRVLSVDVKKKRISLSMKKAK